MDSTLMISEIYSETRPSYLLHKSLIKCNVNEYHLNLIDITYFLFFKKSSASAEMSGNQILYQTSKLTYLKIRTVQLQTFTQINSKHSFNAPIIF